MTTLSRTEAIELHSKTYFTGKPCSRGHIAKRYTSVGSCVECAKQNANTWNNKTRGKIRADHTFGLTVDIHPDDAEAVLVLVDYLNQARGRPTARRPIAPPVDTRTEWERHYDLLKRVHGADTARWLATRRNPETHSPGWTDSAAPPPPPPEVVALREEIEGAVNLGGRKPSLLTD